MTPADHMAAWMRAASTAEQEALARKAGTSRAYLYILSAGRRTPSPELGAALEAASTRMPNLPQLRQVDLVPACSRCRFAKHCKDKA